VATKPFALNPVRRRPCDTEFTSAEIKSCRRLAALLEIRVIDAARQIGPVGDSVERLRARTSDRLWPAVGWNGELRKSELSSHFIRKDHWQDGWPGQSERGERAPERSGAR
jgi:hypothetical protein